MHVMKGEMEGKEKEGEEDLQEVKGRRRRKEATWSSSSSPPA